MTSSDARRPETATDLLRMRAEETPADIATFHRLPTGAWVPTTWAALWEEVQQAAAVFSTAGLGHRERLAIQARTCREWQVAELGANLIGASVVGIDTQASSEQVSWMLQHANVTGMVIEHPSCLAKIPAKCRDRLKSVLSLDEGTETPSGVRYLRWAPTVTAAVATRPDPTQAPTRDTPAMLIYTSGTTGMPKAIEYTHGQLMTACWTMLDEFHGCERARFVCWLPMSAMFQRMMNLTALASGSVTYFVENPRDIMARLPEIRPTVFTSVPRFYEKVYDGIQEQLATGSGFRKRLVNTALAAGAQRSRSHTHPGRIRRIRHAILDRVVLGRLRAIMGGELRWMISGSAATPVWLLEFFQSIGLAVLEAYGVTENPLPIAANRPGAYRIGSVGKPFSMNDVRLGKNGEVLVKGPTLFRGYLGEAPTCQQFTDDGYYRTGDYGHFDSDGFLYLSGRAAEIIKTSTGRRISPAGIEGVYRQSRYVDQIVIVGNNRPYLVALIALNQPAVESALGRSGLSIPHAEDFQTSSRVTELVDGDLAALGEALARHERIRTFTILSRPLSIEAGELTTTLKLRRERIETLHADVIEKMYSESYQIFDDAVQTSRP